MSCSPGNAEGGARGRRRKGRRMSWARRKTAKTAKTTADYAMPLDRLDPWLQGRAKLLEHHRPAVSCLSGFDGFVTAIVAGPVSMPPPDWICPLLGVEPDAFNHDNEEFSAIAATAMRHNAIGDGLAAEPRRVEPLFENALKMERSMHDLGAWAFTPP